MTLGEICNTLRGAWGEYVARRVLEIDLAHWLVYNIFRGELCLHIQYSRSKTHFSKLLERVLKGEEVVIAKAGKPIARIIYRLSTMHHIASPAMTLARSLLLQISMIR